MLCPRELWEVLIWDSGNDWNCAIWLLGVLVKALRMVLLLSLSLLWVVVVRFVVAAVADLCGC